MAAEDGSAGQRRASRRSLLKYALGTLGSLGSLATPGAEVLPVTAPRAAYHLVDRREIPGGSGMFIAMLTTATREELRALGESLREEFREQANVVIEVFDDVDAARTVRAGSRVVGEARFAAARTHQRASYQKDQRTGKHVFTILDAPLEVIRYN